MTLRLPAAILLAAALSVPPSPAAQQAQDPAPAALPDLSALLECRLGYADFMAYMPVLQDPLRAVALGWRPQPQANPFMLDYRLNTPVTVSKMPSPSLSTLSSQPPVAPVIGARMSLPQIRPSAFWSVILLRPRRRRLSRSPTNSGGSTATTPNAPTAKSPSPPEQHGWRWRSPKRSVVG